jgi:M6 family metalloprotease-like protein
MRKILLLAALFVANMVQAIPAKPIWKTFVQKDGTSIKVKLVGDERSHYWLTEKNVAMVEKEGQLVTADINLMKSKQVLRSRSNELGVPKTYVGDKKGLIILVDFPDKQFKESNPQEVWNDIANKVGYNENDHIGSVHDYFYDQSYGKFNLTFDVVGPIRMKHYLAYYGSNNDAKAGEMIKEACEGANSTVNYHDYDWDNDGEVDQVFVLYAGYGQATSGVAEQVWPHEYQLSYTSVGSSITLDGCVIDKYACSNELYNYSYTKNGNTRYKDVNMGIGVICHEFSHCLGLPDYYDTQYTGNVGMGSWDLLASGCYNGKKGIGEVPAGYTSYERSFAGWLDIIPLDRYEEHISGMKPLTRDGATAYSIANPNHTNEYYILENRAIERWDEYIGINSYRQYSAKGGLLALHVDYNSDVWAQNRVNVGNVERMTMLHASGAGLVDESRDAFPLGSKNAISDSTTPSFVLNNRNYDGSYQLHSQVVNIALATDSTISFDYIPDPIRNATGIASQSVTPDKPVETVFNLQGVRMQGKLENLPTGIYLVRYVDGSVRKVMR